ncbi:hypothetical protein DACRYDRAFT_105908 [Dacryopinax primogenitus]|uniref:SWI5-dependent HO expression protein 3 n=1 Tax=Dacryopinax primogenitus (strain DJM 731) TaxID=1858805 RepID=M5GCA2_DACPD|nr:uncharacterized protein DACRYDRAFT_105908 [Dacryopinax primogenitus]EJU03752.1 hypothetical protein DACRYDRAFT_105908 [Dacryopinax primogenitus]
MSATASAIPLPVASSGSRPPSRQASSRPSSRLSTRGPPSHLGTPRTPEARPPSAYNSGRSAKRTNSHEQLTVIAAAVSDGESHLPLPVANGSVNGTLAPPASIKEGVPEDYLLSRTRSQSPTRSISRIPVSSVGHARALAEDGSLIASTSLPQRSSSLGPLPSPSLNSNGDPLTPTSLSGDLQLSPSPSSPNFASSSYRMSMSLRKASGNGNTTKVLAELQAGVSNARNALENTKNQLRTSQRQVAQLTRQNEDLKDGRERMRIEIENLNNVVARKERLLQELLERARKAEAEALALKSQLKSETTASKSALKDMEKQVSEATAVSQKSHREFITLSETVKSMTGHWKADMDAVRKEMAKREELHRHEVDECTKKSQNVIKLVQASKSERAQLDALKREAYTANQGLATLLKPHMDKLLQTSSRSDANSAEALKIAQDIQAELARIRRLMRVGHGPTPSVSGFSSSIHPSPATPDLASISE